MSATRAPSLPGIATAEETRASGAFLARVQRPSGRIPWYDGGHADPWNHVEAAMALTVTGYRHEALAAYDWLAHAQLAEGAWFAAYGDDGARNLRLDTNFAAYVATGLWHYLLVTGDVDSVATRFDVVARALDFVVAQCRDDATPAWSVDGRGKTESFALLAGSSSIYHSLRCAVALAERLDVDTDRWLHVAAALAHAIVAHPEAFAEKSHFAMDWYYPVLAGALTGDAARDHLDTGATHFVLEGHGVRCVVPNNWITAAETAECALAYDALGRREEALALLAGTAAHRREDGAYLTGWVYPQRVTFPTNEVSSYSAAAVLLAVDALSETTGGAGLFRHDSLAPLVHDTSRCPRCV